MGLWLLSVGLMPIIIATTALSRITTQTGMEGLSLVRALNQRDSLSAVCRFIGLLRIRVAKKNADQHSDSISVPPSLRPPRPAVRNRLRSPRASRRAAPRRTAPHRTAPPAPAGGLPCVKLHARY